MFQQQKKRVTDNKNNSTLIATLLKYEMSARAASRRLVNTKRFPDSKKIPRT